MVACLELPLPVFFQHRFNIIFLIASSTRSRPDTKPFFAVHRHKRGPCRRVVSFVCLVGGWLSPSSKRLKTRPSLLWNTNWKPHPSFPVVGPYHFYIHSVTFNPDFKVTPLFDTNCLMNIRR